MDYYLEELCNLGVIRVNDELCIRENYNYDKEQSKDPKPVDIVRWLALITEN